MLIDIFHIDGMFVHKRKETLFDKINSADCIKNIKQSI